MSEQREVPIIPEDLQEWYIDTQIRERVWESCVVRLLIERIGRAESELAALQQAWASKVGDGTDKITPGKSCR